MAKAPRKPPAERASAERVDAPATQTRAPRRLPPGFALAWLHLLPESAFPIRSRDDMATKIAALLIAPAPSAKTHRAGLPAGAQPGPGRTRGAR